MDLGISLLGFIVGVLVGLTGVGIGSVTTPVLILAGVRPTVAVASVLLYAAITKGVGAIQHLRQGSVHLPLVFYLSLGSVPAGLLGAKLFTDLERGLGPALDVWVTRMVAVLLILLSAPTLLDLLRPRTDRPRKPPLPWTGSVRLLTVFVGAGVGLLVSFTSIVAALLLSLYRLPRSEERRVGKECRL